MKIHLPIMVVGVMASLVWAIVTPKVFESGRGTIVCGASVEVPDSVCRADTGQMALRFGMGAVAALALSLGAGAMRGSGNETPHAE